MSKNVLKAYAVAKGVKLVKVAQMLGVHPNTITRWIKNGVNTEMVKATIDAVELSQRVPEEVKPV